MGQTNASSCKIKQHKALKWENKLISSRKSKTEIQLGNMKYACYFLVSSVHHCYQLLCGLTKCLSIFSATYSQKIFPYPSKKKKSFEIQSCGKENGRRHRYYSPLNKTLLIQTCL